jgi:hypothetical protein
VGRFARTLTFWFCIEGPVRSATIEKRRNRTAAGQKRTLPATLPHTWSAKGRQDLGAIANDDATSTGVCKIHCNVSACACCTGKQYCRCPPESRGPPIPARHDTPAYADRDERRLQARWKRRGKIKVSIRRHKEDISHPWVLPDTDLASATQSTLAARHFPQRGLLFEARIHRSHAYWHKAAAVQPSPIATDNIVRMKIPECYGPEEIALERSGSRDQYPELLARSAS